MPDSPPTTQINCRQCAAPLPVEQGTQFVTCAFCGATNFVDKTRAVFHYSVRATVREADALSALRRWMAGNATVKGLDRQAKIESPAFEYFPLWMIRLAQDGQERVLLKPAAALSVSELEHVVIPAADLAPYDSALNATIVPPSVPYETMQQWLSDDHKVGSDAVREVSLVHVPVYKCKYEYGGRRYTALVDGATSRVFANIYPAKWEVPYVAIAAAAFIAYFVLALISLATSVIVFVVVAPILAVPIFLIAAAISAKV
jgi:LSD1 subclass zinc finger protein